MSNLKITSTENTIRFDYGIYGENIDKTTETVLRKHLESVSLIKDNTRVRIDIYNWDTLALVASEFWTLMVVDDVNGEAPTDIMDLYEKLSSLMQ